MKDFTSRFASLFLVFVQSVSLTFGTFLAKASCKTVTKGPFQERNTAYSSASEFLILLAKSSQTKVFPAQGTPVTKHIDFLWRVREFEIMAAIFSAVLDRFLAQASDLVISVTECHSYSACAASTMVGVGLYLALSHVATSI